MKKKWFCFCAVMLGALVLIGADQWSKWAAFHSLKGRAPVLVIPHLLEFCYVENYAAAMGLYEGLIWLVILCTIVVSIGILIALVAYKEHTVFSYLTCMLLLAGGLGNLCDRFLHVFVVDFIHVLFFPYVFNVADCCVTIGVVCFGIHCLVLNRREKASASQEEA